MTFEEWEKEKFFDVISDLTGHHDKDNEVILIGLTQAQIINRVAEKIPRKRAIQLFEEFTEEGNKYLDDQQEAVYRISASGRKLYWGYLKNEATKADLDIKSVNSTIKTGLYTRRNMWIVGSIAFVSMIFVILNFISTNQREQRELQKEIRELQLRLLESQQRQQNNTPNSQIHLHFSDTSLPLLRVRVDKE